MSDLAYLSIAQGRARIAAGTLQAIDWTEALLGRIAALDGKVHSYVTVTADAARAAARMVTPGDTRLLAGVPIGLKDAIDTAGIRTTGHSRIHEHRVPLRDASLVTRLKQAGAVILGKHALHELCYGGPSFELPWPPPGNPWNLDRIPGGSSSGTSAALAAGMAAGGIGTDSGGSIRQPSAFCGLTGLKPTHGIVPIDGIFPLSQTLDVAGPMARSAEDCALLLDALSGTRARSATSREVAALRIGVLDWHTHVPVDPAIPPALDAALQLLAKLGAKVARVNSLPDIFDLDACARVILLAESFAVHEAQLRRDANAYGRIGRHRFAIGACLSAADYIDAMKLRPRLIRGMDALFDEFDVLIAANELSGAPTFDSVQDSFPFTKVPSMRIPFSLTGQPSLAVPCGVDHDVMPIGMQIIAARGRDDLVLALGAAYQRASDWHRAHPRMPGA